jgi:hypothetical protein
MVQFDNHPRPEVIKEERPPEPCLRALRRERDDNLRKMETAILAARPSLIRKFSNLLALDQA